MCHKRKRVWTRYSFLGLLGCSLAAGKRVLTLGNGVRDSIRRFCLVYIYVNYIYFMLHKYVGLNKEESVIASVASITKSLLSQQL